MSVKLTPAQARKLGIATGAGKGRRGGSQPPNEQSAERPAPSRSTRKTAKGRYHTRCKTCGEEFRTIAAEDRHLKEHHHARYELVL